MGRKKEDIVCVVDGANDVKLFDICGLGIAYRAQDLVKDLATTTLEEKDLSKFRYTKNTTSGIRDYYSSINNFCTLLIVYYWK